LYNIALIDVTTNLILHAPQAEVDAEDNRNRTPLDFAILAEREDTMEVLTPSQRAFRRASLQSVKDLLSVQEATESKAGEYYLARPDFHGPEVRRGSFFDGTFDSTNLPTRCLRASAAAAAAPR
jgi:ankyrin repeat protein